MDTETSTRIADLGHMVSEHLRGLSAAQRDRNLQLFLAQAKTPVERLRATGLLTTSLMRLRQAYRMASTDG